MRSATHSLLSWTDNIKVQVRTLSPLEFTLLCTLKFSVLKVHLKPN